MLSSEIDDENKAMLRRQKQFRHAAEYIATGLSEIRQVEKAVLFGSVAQPLKMEVPRFRRFKHTGIAILHECKDVDIAIWVSDLNILQVIQKARAKALNRLLEEKQIGVAHHQIDLFVMEPATNRYLGRLCWFSSCPKEKEDCRVPGCGKFRFLRQHEGFNFDPKNVDCQTSIILLNRQTSIGNPR